MNNKKEVPCIFYYYLHYNLRKKYKDTIISTKEAMKFLFRWRIPSNIRPVIIKELEILDLVDRTSKKTIKLKQSNFDIEDIRNFCKAVKIY